MSTDPLDPAEEIVSIASAALTEAAAMAATPGSGIIFRDEWLPETRTRGGSTPGVNQTWADVARSPQSPGSQPSSSGPTQQSSGSQRLGHQARVPDARRAPSAASTSLLSPELEGLAGPTEELLARNQDVFDAVINHAFPRAFGKGSASLDGFRYYMVQDMLYLRTCARIKLAATSSLTDENWDKVEAFGDRHDSSLRSVKKTMEICSNLLGIPDTVIGTTMRSAQLKEIDELYTTTVQGKDANLAYFIVLLPCVLTYWTIAARLMKDSSTAKNVVYHDAWTVINHDRSSVVKYNKHRRKGWRKSMERHLQSCLHRRSQNVRYGLVPVRYPIPYHLRWNLFPPHVLREECRARH
ncbi:hypothetical protein B0H14DRAFT_662277 [Mycena olivaceomarginata]|nr:hypothetical protein B0H14DRAFT_662277 [Mycena olivaceomarginata]